MMGKKGIHMKLAVSGIKKNCKLYLPYLLTGTMMAAVLYMISYLSNTGALSGMPGYDSLTQILTFGVFVMSVFSLVFLFYTNSFLIRRRMKEYGLYNMLGMGKNNIVRLLLCETVITYAGTVSVGTGIGIALSKLAEILLANVVKGIVSYDFSIQPGSVGLVFGTYAFLYLLIFLNGIRILRKSRPVELMKSEAEGEKPPRSNILLGILGVVFVACAYFLAVSIEEPMEALFYFMLAVIMVILGTYLVFISGSVILCRKLMKNKSYYYSRKHFVSVSQMVYRMKRNGAGLASICILMTMVLVTMSATTSLYIGKEDCIRNRYTREVNVSWMQYGYDSGGPGLNERYKAELDQTTARQGVKKKNARNYEEYMITGCLEDSCVKMTLNSKSNLAFVDYGKICDIHFIDIEDYNRMFGKSYDPEPGEAVVLPVRTDDLSESLTVGDKKFKVIERLDKGSIDLFGSGDAAVCSSMFVFIPDMKKTVAPYDAFKDYDGEDMLCHYWHYEFDPAEKLSNEKMEKLVSGIQSRISRHDHWNVTSESRQLKKSDFYGTFGGLLFLGVMLSLMFLVAAILIIYYKQVSEGYEDQNRFQIMQKVGMTKGDIRRTVNSQMLTLFMMPILMACIHLGFAFPFINRILVLFGLMNVGLLVAVTAGSALVLALIYILAYKVTSNAYYRLVS